MTTDFRALCVELTEALRRQHDWYIEDNGATLPQVDELVVRAETTLAESDGPAVSDDREPASVAGKSSDENCWQWYTYCPEEGLEMYSDRKQAQSAAQSIMGSYEVAAHSDGWHEDMELVSWGMLVPVEQAQVVERKTAEPDDEFDEWVKYELRPVRYGHQPAPAAEGEVRGLVAALRKEAEGWFHMKTYSYGKWASKLTRAATLLEQLSAQAPQPVAVSERLPEPNTKVLAHYFNDLGKGRTICAIWVSAKTRSDSYGDNDFTEYDEESDTFYWPEGWYEAIENWDDLGYVKVDEGEVIFWQPLPKWPANALPLPAFWEGHCDKSSTPGDQ